MSTNNPFGPSGGPEYIGSDIPSEAPDGPHEGKRWGVMGAVTAGVVGVVALGGWGAYALLAGGGDQPADVIPSNAVGYVSLDLDPSAAQKIEAFKILNKFPAAEKELDVSSKDDIRKLVFTGMQDEGTCENLDYAKDIEPWIGDRVAMAGAPVGGETVPLMALQVSDEEAAATGVETLAKCGEAGEDFGYAFLDGYVLISDSDKHAEALASAAEKTPLADDPDFQEWMDQVGDPGFVTAYVAPEGPKFLFEEMGKGFTDSEGPLVDEGTMLPPDLGTEMNRTFEQFAKQYEDFEGGAAVIRFEDGAVEAEFAGKGLPAGVASLAQSGVAPISGLPASTGIALSVGLTEGWLEDAMSNMPGEAGMSVEDMLREAEAVSGLSLPEDVETLLGDGFAVAVDSGADWAKLIEAEDPTQLPIGIRVEGNPDEILPVVEKIQAKLGPEAEMLVVESGDGVVVFGVNPEYTRSLLEQGSLGDDAAFQNVVPEADSANSVFYLNFDAGDGWAESLADLIGDGAPDVKANVAPLDALGVSGWTDSDDVQRGLLRLTTD